MENFRQFDLPTLFTGKPEFPFECGTKQTKSFIQDGKERGERTENFSRKDDYDDSW
jgi:hypothetical protein